MSTTFLCPTVKPGPLHVLLEAALLSGPPVVQKGIGPKKNNIFLIVFEESYFVVNI